MDTVICAPFEQGPCHRNYVYFEMGQIAEQCDERAAAWTDGGWSRLRYYGGPPAWR